MGRPRFLVLLLAFHQRALLGEALSLALESRPTVGRQPNVLPPTLQAGMPENCFQEYKKLGIDLNDPKYKQHCMGPASANMCVISCNKGWQGLTSQYMCSYGTLEKMMGPELPGCLRNQCTGPLPNGEGIIHNCVNVTLGTSCEASCDKGHEGTTESFDCSLTGELTGKLPTCKRQPCEIPKSLITTKCFGVVVGQTCPVPCMDGYTGGPVLMECTLDGLIPSPKGEAAQCMPKTCTRGLPMENSTNSRECHGVTTGQTCNISCAPGYIGEPEPFFCLETGTFVGIPPTCAVMNDLELGKKRKE